MILPQDSSNIKSEMLSQNKYFRQSTSGEALVAPAPAPTPGKTITPAPDNKEMTTEFKAKAVAESVQKNFANKVLSNKVVAKNLLDDNSASLLDNLYLLLFVFTKNKKRLREDNKEHHKDINQIG